MFKPGVCLCGGTVPGLGVTKKLSAAQLALLDVFENSVKFVEELVVWKLFLRCFGLQQLQVTNR